MRVFAALAAAEAQIHGVAVDAVHFHEVGAVDSIVDIVGTAVALDLLSIEAIYASPFATGHGWVRSQHGRIPVPAPATLALIAAARAPLVPLDTDKETVTPTGAAIVTALARGYERPAMTVQAVGYGFGTRVMPWPNCLRVWIGDAMPTTRRRRRALRRYARIRVPVAPTPASDDELLIEANLDDMTPEALAYALEAVFAAGALDAWFTPITMKKSRPAVTLSAICAAETAEAVTIQYSARDEHVRCARRADPAHESGPPLGNCRDAVGACAGEDQNSWWHRAGGGAGIRNGGGAGTRGGRTIP